MIIKITISCQNSKKFKFFSNVFICHSSSLIRLLSNPGGIFITSFYHFLSHRENFWLAKKLKVIHRVSVRTGAYSNSQLITFGVDSAIK